MRRVFVTILAASCLAGCATVSMVPGETTVETGIAAEQSSLRQVSNAYIKQAKREKWIEDTGGFWSLAKVLVDGSDKTDSKTASYVDHIKSDDPTSSLSRVTADIQASQRGLDVVVREADKLLGASISEKSLRTDVYSFESALVTAQQSRRNFALAVDTLSGDRVAATDALTAFDASIDLAKDKADQLVDARLTKDQSVSGS